MNQLFEIISFLCIIFLLAIIVYWLPRVVSRKQNTVDDFQGIETSLPEISQYIKLWVNTLAESSLLDDLFARQNSIVIGARNSGVTAVMWYSAQAINEQKSKYSHAAIYVNLGQLARLSTVQSWTAIDVLYRATILTLVRHLVAVRTPSEAKYSVVQMSRVLNNQVTGINFRKVRYLTYRLLDRCGIDGLSLFLDNLSSLPMETIPIFLEFLIETFPRGGHISLVLGGEMEKLQLQKHTPEGVVGLEVRHDLVIGLDLNSVLRSPNIAPSPADPRQKYLIRLLEQKSAVLVRLVEDGTIYRWDNLFAEPDLWFRLFIKSEFNVETVGRAFEDLIPELSIDPEQKLSALMIDHAINRMTYIVS